MRIVAISGALLLAACHAPVENRETGNVSGKEVTTAPAHPQPQADARKPAKPEPRYTSIDPAQCRLLEKNEGEAGYFLHRCKGVDGFELERSESDLRVDIAVLPPSGAGTRLGLNRIVAKGAFADTGSTAEWRGRPTARSLILRYVMEGPQPGQSQSKLVVIRLSPTPCLVAIVPPGPGQNQAARAVADRKGSACLSES